jgi:hypothetical protein
MVLILLILGVASAGIGITTWWHLRVTAKIEDSLAPLAFGIRWCPADSVGQDVLLAHLNTAMRAICFRVEGVTPEALQVALQGVIIRVRNTDKWLSTTEGTNVAGETTFVGYTQVIVGQGLEALCHELCHAYEVGSHRPVDYKHLGWTANGMAAAVNEYISGL